MRMIDERRSGRVLACLVCLKLEGGVDMGGDCIEV
jgi:hypothetical protein